MSRLPTFSVLAIAAAAILSALFATPASAQSEPYYYLGLSGGQSRGQIDESRISNRLIGPGLMINSITSQERDIAWKAFGGYQFNRYLAAEAGFFSLGAFDFTTTTTPAGKLQGQTQVQGINLDLVATMPVGDRLSGLARVGGQYARTRGEYTASDAVGPFRNTPSDRRTNLKVGLGLQYEFIPAFLMRGEVERYRVSDAMDSRDPVNAFTLSAVFPFGRAPQATRTAYVAPAYVAPVYAAPAYVAPARQPVPMAMPAPAPVPVPAAVVVPAAPVMAAAPQPRRVSFSVDSLFGFDQSTVRPGSKTAPDTFARALQGAQYDTIKVEGHTDRLGSTAYNQKLSQQRAEAVKAYLFSSGGLAASKISAAGKGKSTPVSKPEDCKGERAARKLISCLQADRRVDIEVTGTR